MVSGLGSTWTCDRLSVWNGTLDILDGGTVINRLGGIASGSMVTVNGTGSKWTSNLSLSIDGTLTITDGGMASVAEILKVDYNDNGDGCINMARGGMLALRGEADGSLDDFLGLIDGTDAIRYWDDSISDWTDITSAVEDEDYTLNYQTEGNFAGYTVLTVGVVPEPSTLILLGLLLAVIPMIRCR